MQDWLAPILTQYRNDPVMLAVVESWNDSLDPSEFFDRFYDEVWNIDTAGTYGLDVWGRILGVGRVLSLASVKYFGFDEATTLSADPFNTSPFYSGKMLTDNYDLSNDGYRTLLYAKALANISNGSVPSINGILMTLFSGRGNAYVKDNQDMSLTYNFTFLLTPVEVAIVQSSGVLPKPTGTRIIFTQGAES